MKNSTKKNINRRVYRKRNVAKKVATPSKSFVKKVKNVLRAEVETKQAYHSTGDSLVYFNSGINSSADLQKIMPNIASGTADNQKIGDEIRAKKITIKGHMFMAPDTTTSSANKRIAVRMMIIQPKRFPNQDDSYTNFSSWYGQLLKKGGTQTAFVGNISDLYADINTEDITCYYDKRFYLSQDNIFQLVGSSTPTQHIAQNIQNTVKFFNITLPLRNRLLKYDASVSSNLLPTNYGPVLVLGYAHLDGSGGDTVDTQVGLCYDCTIHYEDA